MADSAVTGIEAIVAGLGIAGIAAIKCAADIETMTTAFSTLLGSADAGNAMTKQLQDLAIITPYTTEQLGKGARQMLAYGFAAKDIPGLLVNIGNASSALGLGAEGMQRITLALGQMGAKGTVQADEMRQLAEAGIPSWKALADTMGVSIPQAMAAVEKRSVSSATGITAVLTAMNDKFGGGMEAQSKTIAGSVSNIIDSMQLLGGAVGQGINKFTGLSSILSTAGDYIAAFTRIIQSDGIGTAIQQLVPPGVILGITTFGGVITAIAVPALFSMAGAAVSALAPFLPLIAVGVALGVVAFEIYQNWSIIGPLFTSVCDLISTLISGAYDAVAWAFTAMFDSAESNVSAILDVVSGIFGGIIELGSWLVDGVGSVIPVAADIFRAVFGDTIYNTVAGVVTSMTDLFNQFVNWLSQKLSGVLTFASKVYNSIANVIGAAKSTDWGNIKLGFDTPDIKGTIANILPKTNVPAVTNPDLSGFGAGDATKEEKGKKDKAAKEAAQVVKAEADYEIDVQKNKAKIVQAIVKDELSELDRERKGGLAGIREYWSSREKEDTAGLAIIQAYWDKRGALESQGVQAEIDALNAEKSAVQDQINNTSDPSDSINLKKKMLDVDTQIVLKERELVEVSKKNTEQAKEEAAAYIEKYAALMKSTRESMKNTGTTNYINSLQGSAKDVAGFDKDKADSVKSVQDIVDAWQKGTAEIKDQYGVVITDTVGLDKWKAQQLEMIDKASDDKRLQYYAQCKGIQADIDAAYANSSLAQLKQVLTAENAERMNNYNAQKSMMDTYQSAFLAAHSTTAGLIANAYSGVFDSLKTNISSMIMYTSSLSDAWSALGQSLRQVVADYVAKWIAGRLTIALFGKQQDIVEAASSAAKAGVLVTGYAAATTAATAYYAAKTTAATASQTAITAASAAALVTTTAASVAAGTAIAAAWVAAAAMVSLASFGANSAPAMAGIIATTALSASLSTAGALATGGAVRGPGTGTSDSILSWLSNGEGVLNARAMSGIGVANLNYMNDTGKLPGFATGGPVTGPSLSSVSAGYSAVATNKSSYAANTSINDGKQQVAFSPSLHVSMLDTKDLKKFLRTGGGVEVQKFFAKQARSFALNP